MTQILPTNEYLFRYKVKETKMCDRCLTECDTIVHRLYDCEYLVQILSYIFSFLKTECSQLVNITMRDYLFGTDDHKRKTPC